MGLTKEEAIQVCFDVASHILGTALTPPNLNTVETDINYFLINVNNNVLTVNSDGHRWSTLVTPTKIDQDILDYEVILSVKRDPKMNTLDVFVFYNPQEPTMSMNIEINEERQDIRFYRDVNAASFTRKGYIATFKYYEEVFYGVGGILNRKL